MTRVAIEDGQYILRDDWRIEDIKGQDEDLTDEQAIEVMRFIAHTHDASIGINWDVIDSAIDIVKAREGETK